MAEVEEQQQRDRAGGVAHEAEILRRNIPDWDSKGAVRLSSYLKSKGFTPDELTVHDSRQLILAEKARLYDAFQADRRRDCRSRLNRTAHGERRRRQYQAESIVVEWSGQTVPGTKKVAKTSGNMRDAGRAIAALLGK